MKPRAREADGGGDAAEPVGKGVGISRGSIAALTDEADGGPLYGDRPMTARMAARLWYVADFTCGSYFDGMAETWLAALP